MKNKKILIIMFLMLFSLFFFRVKTIASTSDYKYYTYGIVDGGIYKIKNVSTGLYMNVSSNTSNTLVKLASSSSSDSQKFYVKYLGSNRYQIEPIGSNLVKLKVSSPDSGSSVVLYTNNNTSPSQRFRILAVNSSQYNIFSTKTNYETALHSKWDSTNGYYVAHTNVSDLTSNQMKWEFEKVDTTCDIYNTYFLRDYNTGLYITLPEQTNNTQIILNEFTGREEQRFKQYNSGAFYTFIPMSKTDLALEYDSSYNLVVNKYDGDSNQKFKKSNQGSYIRLYVTIGDVTYYVSKDSNNNVFLSSNYSDSIKIVLENALFETAYNYRNYEDHVIVNTITEYGAFHLYNVRPDHNGEYTFFINKLSGNMSLSLFDASGNSVNMNETTSNNIKTYRAYLEKDCIYYVKTLKEASVNVEYYYYCMPDLVVYLHGMNTSFRDGHPNRYDARTYFSIPASNLLNSYNYYDPIINTESDMTSSFVRNVDPLTGIVPLQAPIYIFRGHGGASSNESTKVIYSTGTNSSAGSETKLYGYDLYDLSNDIILQSMSGNKLSIWAGCKTASEANNIAFASYAAGSLCSIGFGLSIGTDATNRFTINLMEEIENGYNISDAVDRAHSGISFWFSNLGSATFYGDYTQVLKPSVPSQFNNRNSNNNTNQEFDISMLNGYTYMYENNRGTLRRYVKFINGYETDDYIDVYYDGDNNIKGYFKSNSTYDSKNLSKNDYSIYFNNSCIFFNDDMRNISDVSSYDYLYTIDNKITPIRCFTYYHYNDDNELLYDMKIFNLITNEELSSEVIFQ